MPRHGLAWFLPVVLAMVGSTAVAAIEEPAIRIIASNASGTATWTKPLVDFSYDPGIGDYSYHVNSTLDLKTPDGITTVAKLRQFHLYMVDDWSPGPPERNARIIVQASVMAGQTETTFTITPGFMSFSPIPAPDAAAVMSWTFIVTDNQSSGDNHAKMQGAPLGEDIYRATYNGTTRFGNSATLLEANGSSGASMTMDDTIPDFGMDPLGVAVSSMNMEYGFTLSPLDYGQLQSTFVLSTPEPATIALVVLGAVSLLGRRR